MGHARGGLWIALLATVAVSPSIVSAQGSGVLLEDGAPDPDPVGAPVAAPPGRAADAASPAGGRAPLPVPSPVLAEAAEAGRPRTRVEWRAVPIRVGGSVGTSLTYFDSPFGSAASESLDLALNASSYLIRPDLATFNVSATLSQSASGSEFGSLDNRGNSRSIFGNGNLFGMYSTPVNFGGGQTVIHTSRGGDQKRSDMFLTAAKHFNNADWGVFKGVSGGGNYGHTARWSDGEVSRTHSLNGSLGGRLGSVGVTGSGTFFRQESNGVSSPTSRILSSGLTHAYSYEDYDIVQTSSATYNQTDDGVATRNHVLIARTNVDWIPDYDIPLKIIFDLSGSRSRLESPAAMANLATISLSESMSYTAGRWSYGASSSQAFVESDNNKTSVTTFSGSASYSGESRQLWSGQHGWGGGANANCLSARQSSGPSTSNCTESVNVSQNFSRNFPGAGAPMMLAATQNAAISHSDTLAGAEFSGSIGHSVSLSQAIQIREGVQGSWAAAAADTRPLFGPTSETQSASLTGSFSEDLGRYEQWGGSSNLSFGRASDSRGTSTNWSGGASARYSNRRFAGVRLLGYSATYNLGVVPPSRGEGWRLTHYGSQNLGYTIGKLTLTASNTVSYFAQALIWSVNLNARRTF